MIITAYCLYVYTTYFLNIDINIWFRLDELLICKSVCSASVSYWGHMTMYILYRECRDHFVYGYSQWETTLQRNVISYWLDAHPKWFLGIVWIRGWNAIFVFFISNIQGKIFSNKTVLLCCPVTCTDIHRYIHTYIYTYMAYTHKIIQLT